MKRFPLVVVLFMLTRLVYGQITMETNLPLVLPLNTELVFDIKIKKGPLTNFSKYQMEVSRDMVIQEVDSKSGSFTFDDNVVKIIWVMTPTDPEINLRLKLNSGVIKGKRTIIQKYFYIENDNKRQVEMESITIVMKDTVNFQPSTVEFYTLKPKMPASIITTSINVDEISTKRPEVLVQQVIQLRKDAKDANEVGEREKKEAQLLISQANEAITAAAAITNDDERKLALEKANEDKQKAEKDLEIAEKVIMLAKSLEDNATEIERINKAVNPGNFKNQGSVATSGVNTVSDPSSSQSTATVNIDALHQVFGPPESKKKEKKKEKEKEVREYELDKETEAGITYKIQLGAFSSKPSKSDFKAIGKVKVIEEAGMYKVLYGNFKTKEEASKERQNIIAKGFDGFVVTYQDGSRVK